VNGNGKSEIPDLIGNGENSDIEEIGLDDSILS